MTMRKTSIKKLIFIAVMIVAGFLVVPIIWAISANDSTLHGAPYMIMDSFDELKTAMSIAEDADIIFPDLSGFDLPEARFDLNLIGRVKTAHDGYSISGLNHMALKYQAPSSGNVYVSKYQYKFSPFPSDMLPLNANRTYKDVPIEFYADMDAPIEYYTESGLYKIPESAPEGMYEKGSLVGDYNYKFEIGAYFYMIGYVLYFPPEVVATVDIDAELANAEKIYFEIVKSIIDQAVGVPEETPAASSETLDATVITDEEFTLIANEMDGFGIGGDVSALILYDHENAPAYILGYTDAGYLIWKRDITAGVEFAEGQSPYANMPDGKKYYGGILCYYVETEQGLLDIGAGEITEQMKYNPALDEIAP